MELRHTTTLHKIEKKTNLWIEHINGWVNKFEAEISADDILMWMVISGSMNALMNKAREICRSECAKIDCFHELEILYAELTIICGSTGQKIGYPKNA